MLGMRWVKSETLQSLEKLLCGGLELGFRRRQFTGTSRVSLSLLSVSNDTSLSLLIRKRAVLPSPSPEHLRTGPLLISSRDRFLIGTGSTVGVANFCSVCSACCCVCPPGSEKCLGRRGRREESNREAWDFQITCPVCAGMRGREGQSPRRRAVEEQGVLAGGEVLRSLTEGLNLE